MKQNKKQRTKQRTKFLFKTIITLIVFLLSTFSITLAKSQVPTVLNSFSEKHDLITHISKKVGIKTLSQEQINSINEYMQIVAYFESKLKNDKNDGYYRGYKNTAKGYFQFLNKSFKWVQKIIKNKIDPEFPNGNYIYEYSYEGQAQFAITLWYQFATKKEIRDLFNRNYNSGFKVYCSYHHTNCSGQLSPSRYRELRSALRNWSKNKYFIGPKENRNIRYSIITETTILPNKSANSISINNNLKLSEKIRLKKIELIKKSIKIIQEKIKEIQSIQAFQSKLK